MTATRSAAIAASHHPPPRTLPRHEPAAEIFLVLVTLAVVASFSRVFAGGDFATPLIVVTVATHLALLAARRKGLGLPVTAAITIPGFVVLASWIFFAQTTWFLLPTADTATAAHHALQSSWSSFQEVVAPTTPEPGFLLAAATGLFFAIFLADWAAFRLWAAVEAIVPSLTVFVFTALVGSARFQVATTTIYAVLALLFVLEHRVAQRERSTAWLANQAERGSAWLLRAGGYLIVAAVLAGIIVGPHLPGAGDVGVISWRGNRDGPSSRVTISPLVDIRSKLIENEKVTLFSVTSPVPAYWRLTALDTFDGQIWRSSGHYSSVSGRLGGTLPSGYDDSNSASEVEQTYRIQALSALWLPAAAQPVAVDAPDTKVRYQDETSTLIVDTNVPTSDGQTYSVTSVLPSFTPEMLQAADTSVPADVAEQDATPPAGLSDQATQLAQAITAGATTPYDKAMALQTFFRETGNFVYDTSVPAGHSDSAIDEVLAARRGYCEQFAGTFAAFARAVGLPARVAVGFTQGISDPTNPQRYDVKGEHAHAWPEVYLGQYQWVPFEPTPGRGNPNAQAYTGVAPAQADQAPDQATTTTSTTTPGPTTTLSEAEAKDLADRLAGVNSAGGSTTTRSSSPWAARLSVVAGVLLVLTLLYLVAVPSLLALRRRRRRHAAHDAAARVQLAWSESEEVLALADQERRPAETTSEFASRAAARVPSQRAGLAELAGATDAALFGSDAVSDTTAAAAEAVAVAVRETVHRSVSKRRRVLRQLDGRRLIGRRP
ncbi:MAG: transglutaminase TgpA family protein [Acidimicrobiales bacterium]